MLGQVATTGALLFALAFLIGWLYLAGLLAAYSLGTWVLAIDPTATALNAFALVVPLYLGATWWQSAETFSRPVQSFRASHRKASVVVILIPLGLIFVGIATGSYWVAAIVAGLMAVWTYLGNPRSLVWTARSSLILMVLVGIASFSWGYVTAVEHQQSPGNTTPLTVMTSVPVPLLPVSRSTGALYEYDGLYLVRSDDSTVIVAAQSGGSRTWLLSRDSIVAMVNRK